MSRRKKQILIVMAVPVSALLLFLALHLYYTFSDWGFSRKVSDTEAARRLSLVQTAQNWLGKNEADGSHREIIDLYNTLDPLPMDYEVLYTDSWCATFVSAAAMKAGLTDILPVECGCERQIGLLQQMGIWQERDTYFPQPGDLIYYAWDEDSIGDCTGWADHVGIVVGTCWPFVKVIEGNKDDRVDYRIVSIWNGTIRGYGIPDYS